MTEPLTREQVEKIAHVMWEEGLPTSSEEILATDAALRARVQELEHCLRLHLAVAPDDPILVEPVEQQVLALQARVREVEQNRDAIATRLNEYTEREARLEGALKAIRDMSQDDFRDQLRTGDSLRIIAALTRLFNMCRDKAQAALTEGATSPGTSSGSPAT